MSQLIENHTRCSLNSNSLGLLAGFRPFVRRIPIGFMIPKKRRLTLTPIHRPEMQTDLGAEWARGVKLSLQLNVASDSMEANHV